MVSYSNLIDFWCNRVCNDGVCTFARKSKIWDGERETDPDVEASISILVRISIRG